MPFRLFEQRKKNRFLSVIETIRLTTQNLLSRRSCTHASGPVVSLTTHGRRMKTAFLAIESIARGTVRPSRLVLALDAPEQGARLPATLRRLQRRGLEIMYAKPAGPHLKYLAYLESGAALDRPLVTADDDLMYPQWWLDRLYVAHKQAPDLIHCFRARRVQLTALGEFAPHSQWLACTDTEASLDTCATGVSGVIYPAAFQRWLLANGRQFEACCPKADDIWLHVMALRGGFKARQIQAEPIHFVGILGTQRDALHRTNVRGFGNDRQIAATYTDEDMALLRQLRH